MRLRKHLLVVGIAATAASLLTISHNSPQGVVSLSLQTPEVRAAPGQAELKHDLSALKIFSMTQLRIKQRYVDPQRIDPRKMLYKALDSVQFNIPEVLVEPDPAMNRVTIVVNDKREVFDTRDVDSPWRLASSLRRIFRFIESNMNTGAELDKVEYAAVNGMLSTLDPHSVLMDPEQAREMDVSTSGKFGGLGIVIRMVKRKLTVIRPMKNTPAWRLGIKAGDHIVKINTQPTENLTSNEAVDRMRGDPGSAVTLWIERKGQTGLLRFDLERAIIRVSQVESKLLDKTVGYIRVKQFSKGIADDVAAAMRMMKGQGAKAWVLDLRWNPGGLLSEAVRLADLFVDAGTIVSQVSRTEKSSQEAEGGNFGDTSSPVVVLVNGGSASASEIVAGALKNLNRAVVLGGRTFGKGSVQELYDNEGGSKLKITVAQYLTPGDKSIQSVGIVPDIALQRMRVPDKNDAPEDWVRLLPPTRSYGEKDLDEHLTSAYAKDTEKPAHELAFLIDNKKPKVAEADAGTDQANPAVEDEEPLDDEIVEDFEMKLAKTIVMAAPAATRQALLKSAAPVLAQTIAEQDQRLANSLAKLGVSWQAGPKTAPTTLEAQLAVNKPLLKAGETAELTVTVRNTGATPARRVLARVHTDDQIFDDTELPIGEVPPGQTKTFTTRVAIPKDALSRVDTLSLELKEQSGATARVQPLDLQIVEQARPEFAYAYHLIDDGNGDGVAQLGEPFRLLVSVRNTGKGASHEASVVLRNASGNGVVLDKSRFELGEIVPGTQRDVVFPVTLGKDFAERELVLELVAYDAALDTQASDKLRFTIAPALASSTGKVGNVVVRAKQAAVRAGASGESTLVGLAAKGQSFTVIGGFGDYQKIKFGDRVGFVAKTDLAPGGTGNGKVVPHWNSTPPSINVATGGKVSDPTFKLKGQVVDESHVEDVYVFVSNQRAKIDGRKIFYRSNRGGQAKHLMDFATDVPLWPGTNQITIIARENTEVKAIKTLFVTRDATLTAQSAKPAIH